MTDGLEFTLSAGLTQLPVFIIEQVISNCVNENSTLHPPAWSMSYRPQEAQEKTA
ncbi:hypothetical protein ACFL27_00945 [candidate division CSSED10-310 bacterium]|uniref:Uncharacterized protein n=1 Tax=candidate division CSSED10-310 bacterium TaxID=2855610 RepID=A0ABV6YRB3_UNCC1